MLLTHRHRRSASRPVLNMASMIDVVFLLLIFFMCTSSFSTPESNLPTQLPSIGPSVQRPEDDFEPIRIGLAGNVLAVSIRMDGRVCADMVELERRLADRRAVADVPVVIEGQGDVPFGDLIATLDLCYKLDFGRVAFSAGGD